MPQQYEDINGGESGESNNVHNSKGNDVKKDSENKPRRFLNGWSKEQEQLICNWSDIATCYKWLHDSSEKIFKRKALGINSTVIILSSIGGFANIGVQSLFEGNQQAIKLSSFAIGGVSLFAGMLTTLNNLLKWSQLEESHRVSSIGWGKFSRLASVEMALHPNDRMDSLDFLKICRAELDRLIEQSPPIPDSVIRTFNNKFGNIRDLKRPEICGAIEHTYAYESSELRLKKLATEAALMLRRKKETLRELVTPEMELQISRQVNERIEEAVEQRKQRLIQELELQSEKQKEDEELAKSLLEARKQKLEKEIEAQRLLIEEQQRKAKEQEELIIHLAEERKKKIEEELELERKRTMTRSESAITNNRMDRLTASSFENRLNINKQQRSVSTRRKSILNENIYKLESGDSTPRQPEPQNEIIIIDKDNI